MSFRQLCIEGRNHLLLVRTLIEREQEESGLSPSVTSTWSMARGARLLIRNKSCFLSWTDIYVYIQVGVQIAISGSISLLSNQISQPKLLLDDISSGALAQPHQSAFAFLFHFMSSRTSLEKLSPATRGDRTPRYLAPFEWASREWHQTERGKPASALQGSFFLVLSVALFS